MRFLTDPLTRVNKEENSMDFLTEAIMSNDWMIHADGTIIMCDLSSITDNFEYWDRIKTLYYMARDTHIDVIITAESQEALTERDLMTLMHISDVYFQKDDPKGWAFYLGLQSFEFASLFLDVSGENDFVKIHPQSEAAMVFGENPHLFVKGYSEVA